VATENQKRIGETNLGEEESVFFFLINKELNELKIRHFISVTTRIQVLRNPIIYRLRLLSIPFKLSKIQNNTEQL